MNIFIDSDVIISALLSAKGASYQLFQKKEPDLYISSISYSELKLVIQRFDIPDSRLATLIKKYVKVITLDETKKEIQTKYARYTPDVNDTHIIAGLYHSHSRFLITYNVKHYNQQQIKQDFNCIVIPPGRYMQYLRSVEK